MKQKFFIMLFLIFILSGCSDTQSSKNLSNTFVQDENMSISFDFGLRSGIYTGTLNSNGLPDGFGKFENISDSGNNWIYYGEWTDGHFNGNGITRWDEYSHIGLYNMDYMEGPGMYSYNDGSVFCGEFNKSEAVKSYIPSDIPEINNNNLSNETVESNKTTTNTITNKYSWEYLSSIYPYATYDDIKSGKYPDQYVILSATIESAEYNDLMNWMECDAWFSHENTYRKDNLVFNLDDFNLDICDPSIIKPTDNIDICIYVNKDNSFGTDIISFKINDSTLTLDDIQTAFIENCQLLNYTDILRNSDSLWGATYSLSGSVFQITKQEDTYVEFLLDTKSKEEYVYVLYFYKDGDPKILENDELTIYGTFYKLFDYVSPLGTNHSVPQISAEFIENYSLE